MQVSVRLSAAVQHKLESALSATHKPRNALINEALEHYLDSLKIDEVQKNIRQRMKAYNLADKRDDLADFGDWP